MTRREFLNALTRAGVALALAPVSCRALRSTATTGVWVNDIHSQLNRTRVRRVLRPGSIEELTDMVRAGRPLSFAGGRHAAGGQQFLTGGELVDMRGLNRVLAFDAERGIVDAESGILWPDLMAELARRQSEWGIVQKQGMDRMSLGGSMGANIHGNGLGLPPIIAQIESFRLVGADGVVRNCSRTENAELFSLVIGGYGMFGPVAAARLRLARRQKLRLEAAWADITEVVPTLEQHRAEDCRYGDWHYSPDAGSKDFLRRGVLVAYRPLDEHDETPVGDGPGITSSDWLRLVTLAHADRGAAFARYAESVLHQTGNIVWSDTFQLDRAYVDDYHAVVDHELHADMPASEALVEFFVPRASLPAFLDGVRADFLRHEVALLYGTVRMVETDNESVLAWAREPVACIVFNFHVRHCEAGVAELAATYRRVVDMAAGLGGTFYLTYHRFATREQTKRCHPRLVECLRAKRRHDPRELFQSDWYRHHRDMFAGAI